MLDSECKQSIQRILEAGKVKELRFVDGKDLATMLDEIAVTMGVKSSMAMPIKKALIKVLRGPKYNHLTQEEFTLAFIFNIEEAYSTVIEHYNDFGLEYCCRVLNAFIRYKEEQFQKLRKLTNAAPPPLPPCTEEENAAWMKLLLQKAFAKYTEGTTLFDKPSPLSSKIAEELKKTDAFAAWFAVQDKGTVKDQATEQFIADQRAMVLCGKKHPKEVNLTPNKKTLEPWARLIYLKAYFDHLTINSLTI